MSAEIRWTFISTRLIIDQIGIIVPSRLTVVYIFQLVYNSKKCVVLTANRQYDVGNVKPAPAVVYSYYEPGLSYVHKSLIFYYVNAIVRSRERVGAVCTIDSGWRDFM